jgi:hypothetical protein
MDDANQSPEVEIKWHLRSAAKALSDTDRIYDYNGAYENPQHHAALSLST